MGAEQVTYGISDGYAPAVDPVPIMVGMYWNIATDSSGNFSGVLTSEQFGGTGTTTGLLTGLFNSIEAVVTSRADESSTDTSNTIITDYQTSDRNGGMEIYVIGVGFGVSVTE